MANTISNLIPVAFRALDTVSRELTGLISAVNLDAAADTIAKGQTINSPVVPTGDSIGDITPAMTVTAAADQTIGAKTLTIDSYKSVGFNWTAEEEFGVNTGSRMERIMQDQLAQKFRQLSNSIELALFTAAYKGASRAIGTTAGTAPILADFAGAKKILDDNGAPMSDRHVVLDTTAGVALRGIANLYKVNESGDSNLLRNGALGNLYGFDLRESAQVGAVTAGAMASATSTSAAFTVGQTLIPLATAGTGVVAAGDIITFANDTNKYVVSSVSFAGAPIPVHGATQRHSGGQAGPSADRSQAHRSCGSAVVVWRGSAMCVCCYMDISRTFPCHAVHDFCCTILRLFSYLAPLLQENGDSLSCRPGSG